MVTNLKGDMCVIIDPQLSVEKWPYSQDSATSLKIPFHSVGLLPSVFKMVK